MTQNKHTLQGALHLGDLHMDVYLYSSEKQPGYEIHYKKEGLFQDKVNFPLEKNRSVISLPNLVALLNYITTLPSQTAIYNDWQTAWILSHEFQTLCRYLAQYKRNSKTRITYFQQAFVYYAPASQTNLYDVVYKERIDGEEKYRELTLLTEEQQTALLHVLAEGVSADIKDRIKKAMDHHFKICHPSELMKNLWITENSADYKPEKDKAAELNAIRDLIIHHY